MRQDEQYKMPLYKLKKDIPLVKAGTIFYYDENDDILGSPGAGCLKLAWTQDNNCQSGLCADTIVFHANATKDREWFEKIQDSAPVSYVPSGVELDGKQLYKRVKGDSGE